MMSASEGGHGKAEIVREVVRILEYKSVPNADKGEGVEKSENFADVIYGCSLTCICFIYLVNLCRVLCPVD